MQETVGNRTHLEILELHGDTLASSIPLTVNLLKALGMFRIHHKSLTRLLREAIGNVEIRLFEHRAQQFHGYLLSSSASIDRDAWHCTDYDHLHRFHMMRAHYVTLVMCMVGPKFHPTIPSTVFHLQPSIRDPKVERSVNMGEACHLDVSE